MTEIVAMNNTSKVFLGVCLILAAIYIVIAILNCIYYKDASKEGSSVSTWPQIPYLRITWSVVILIFFGILFWRSFTNPGTFLLMTGGAAASGIAGYGREFGGFVKSKFTKQSLTEQEQEQEKARKGIQRDQDEAWKEIEKDLRKTEKGRKEAERKERLREERLQELADKELKEMLEIVNGIAFWNSGLKVTNFIKDSFSVFPRNLAMEKRAIIKEFRENRSYEILVRDLVKYYGVSLENRLQRIKFASMEVSRYVDTIKDVPDTARENYTSMTIRELDQALSALVLLDTILQVYLAYCVSNKADEPLLRRLESMIRNNRDILDIISEYIERKRDLVA